MSALVLRATQSDAEKAAAHAAALRSFLVTSLPDVVDSWEAMQLFARVTLALSELADELDALAKAAGNP